MRNGATLALALALGAAGCSESRDTAAAPSESAGDAATSAAAEASTSAPASAPTGAAAVAPAPPTIGETAKPAAAAAVIPGKLRALGTEPFWNARIDGTRVTYTTPEDPQGKSIAVTRHDTVTGAQFAGKLGQVALLIEVARKSCSDGMSDRTYPFSVTLTLGSDRRDGCAA